MSLRHRLKAQSALPALVRNTAIQDVRFVGNAISLWPQDTGKMYVEKGYKLNDAVYSIVSTNADKASQVRLTHMRINPKQKSLLREYKQMLSGQVNNHVLKEAKKIFKAMAADQVPDSKLSKLLNRPNRHMTQGQWIEMLVLLRELQGEGNVWINRGLDGSVPQELMVIPKQHLILQGNMHDPWDILGYQFVCNGAMYNWQKQDVIMWKYQNPTDIDTTFEHLRGLAPLESARVLLQGLNEGDVTVASANASRGASGFAFNKTLTKPTTDQRDDMRRQFNDAINNDEMANKIGILSGEWGYYNIGQTMEELRTLEQYGLGFKRLCRVFRTPSGIFDEGTGTWDNQKQFYRRWIYSKIAPMVYGLRSLLNERLLPEFDLDPETNLIDCDVMTLPEMATDLKEQIDALSKADFLSKNEKRDAAGYEMLGPEYDIVPSDDIGSDLTNDLRELGDDV